MSMTQHEPPPPQSTPPAKSPPEQPDPLASLHKMSTTAGLGSGDYVAVNGTAVFAVILGLASGLTLLEDLLLVIPLAGIVASIMALRQIARSNGTQTGRGLVVLALLLCFGFGGFVFSRKWIERARTAEDRAAIAKLINELGNDISAGNTAAAYQLFSSNFHSKVTQQAFEDRVKLFGQYVGTLKSAHWPGLAEFQIDESTGAQFCITSVEFNFEKKPEPVPEPEAWFRKEGDTWRIESMNQMFPPPRPQAPPGPK